MRLVIQRVNSASVSVSGKAVGNIEKGLFVLLGVCDGDTLEDTKILALKLSKLRVMADDADKMNLSVGDVNASVLVVSQFTLYADTSKGRRPSFVKAAGPDVARELYKMFIRELRDKGVDVQTCEFGAYMKITAELDGPVTIIIDTKENA